MTFTRAPMAKALAAAGYDHCKDAFTYQDYLYELLGDGSSEKPITEQQWEMICDIIGKRKMQYASTTNTIIKNFITKQEKVVS